MTLTRLTWKVQALEALQEYTEHYLVEMFDDPQLCALDEGHSTIMKRDMQLAHRLRGRLGLLSLARIIELIPGNYAHVRFARVKTETGEQVRPLQRLYNLELQEAEIY
ncbi:UNVERIFIED_CONTAM: cnp1 [Trichonephila clavipes]